VAGEAPQLRTRLTELVERHAGVRAALEAGIEVALAEPLRQAREKLAAEQLARHFPAVASGRWEASENLLLEGHHGRLTLASFEDARAFPFLATGGSPYLPGELLVETEDLVFLETAKLMAEGQRAWEGQLALVFEFEDQIAAEIRRSRAERTLKEWESYFLQAFEKKWGEERFERVWRGFGQVPEQAAGKYAAVFGNMAERIRNEVKNQYELAEKIPHEPSPVIENRQTGSEPVSEGSDIRASHTPGDGVAGGGDATVANAFHGGGPISCLEYLLMVVAVSLLVSGILALRWSRFVAIEVADLAGATAAFEAHLKVPPEHLRDQKVRFRLGALRRIILCQRRLATKEPK
jgi:hypothetical protein